MKITSIVSLLVGTGMTGMASLGLPSSPTTAFQNHRSIAEKQMVMNTIRQGGSSRYSNGYYIYSRGYSGGGSSYGK